MMKRFSALLLTALVAVSLAGGVGTASAFAPLTGVNTLAATGYEVDISPLPKADADETSVRAIFAVVFGIIGALSLLMLTIGGFRYITSEGDPQAAAKAKGTIIYALVGLVISIAAVSIVSFVLLRVT
ncbi:MAG TPA: pilin [Candidatus Saccharimonadales bacterium]